MSPGFYRALEDRYRGSRELVGERLRVYLPFVEPLKMLRPAPRAVDLGCGRGEWLELMRNSGIEATGVDVDDGMLEACRKLNLRVVHEDALLHLREMKEASVELVSGFHIAEHLPFPDLLQLVQHAFRVLVPGGILILETPNPENVAVATNTFYIDPTHQRPLPPLLLSFVAEYGRFDRVKILRLQESAPATRETAPNLWTVLSGASPDYSVVAQKEPAAGPRELDGPFQTDHGIDLETLAMRYHAGISEQLQDIASKADRNAEHEVRAAVAEAQAQLLEQQSADLRRQLSEAHQVVESLRSKADRNAEHEARAAVAEAQVELLGQQSGDLRRQLGEAHQMVEFLLTKERRLTNELASNNALLAQSAGQTAKWRQDYEAVISSRSWRLTRPLRLIVGKLKRIGR